MPNSTEMVAEADFMRAGDLPEMHCSSKTNGARAYAPAPLFLAVGQAMVVHVRADRTTTQAGLAARHFLAALHIALRHVAGRKRIGSAQTEGKQEGTGFLDHDSSPFYMDGKNRQGCGATLAPPRQALNSSPLR